MQEAAAQPDVGAKDGELREIVYRLQLHDRLTPVALLLRLAPEGANLSARALSTNLDEKGNVWRLVEVRGAAVDVANAVAAFSGHREVNLLERRIVSTGKYMAVLWYKWAAKERGVTLLTKLTYQSLGPETIVVDQSTKAGLEVRILARGGPRLARLLARLRTLAAEEHWFELVYVGPPRAQLGEDLTAEEDAALQAAMQLGFFEVPRRGSLKQVARALGCSASALSARLRRAEAKLVAARGGPRNGSGIQAQTPPPAGSAADPASEVSRRR